MGIKFVNLVGESKKLIEEFVAKHAGQGAQHKP
jgi:hypothetical protein